MTTTAFDYEAYLRSDAWQKRRGAALEHAAHRCQVCNSSVRLQVHHRTYERVGHEEPADLTVLCDDCHARFHKKMSRRRRDEARRRREQQVGAADRDRVIAELDAEVVSVRAHLLAWGTQPEIDIARLTAMLVNVPDFARYWKHADEARPLEDWQYEISELLKGCGYSTEERLHLLVHHRRLWT